MQPHCRVHRRKHELLELFKYRYTTLFKDCRTGGESGADCNMEYDVGYCMIDISVDYDRDARKTPRYGHSG